MLLNLLSPMLVNNLTGRAHIKIAMIVSGLLLIAGSWVTIAIYFYFIDDYSKAVAALISAGASLALAFIIIGVTYSICRKMEEKMVNNALIGALPVLRSAVPLANKIVSQLNPHRLKIIMPVAMTAWYLFTKKRR